MCILKNARQAEEAVIRLGVAGFANEHISVLLPDAEGTLRKRNARVAVALHEQPLIAGQVRAPHHDHGLGR